MLVGYMDPYLGYSLTQKAAVAVIRTVAVLSYPDLLETECKNSMMLLILVIMKSNDNI